MDKAMAWACVKALDSARAALAKVLAEKEAMRNEVLVPVRAELDALEAEYQSVIGAAQDGVAMAEADARAAVLALGESVHAGHTQVVYVSSGWRWDVNKLNGVVTVLPQLEPLRTATPAQTRVSDWKGKGE